MPFDFAAAKSLVRQTVHNTLAVQAFYEDDTMSVPVEIRARYHNKIDRFGDIESMNTAEFIQGVDRVVLMPHETPELKFRQHGIISFPVYGKKFALAQLEPRTGTLGRLWQVTEER